MTATQGFDEATKSRLIETNGIDIISESERTAKPRDLFWPWFAANVSVFGMSYAAFIYGFGVSFWQAVLVALIGIPVSSRCAASSRSPASAARCRR